jgi:N utilization substance protein A
LSVLVPNALQPAEVEDVILCPMLGKVIVLVRDDQLSLAIGKFGQNVRLASKLVGWDINVMTQVELDAKLDKSIEAFCVIPEVTPELAESLVSQGFFSFDDLSVIEPDQLMEISGLSEEDCSRIVDYADEESARLEAEEKFQAEQRKLSGAQSESAPPVPPGAPAVDSADVG